MDRSFESACRRLAALGLMLAIVACGPAPPRADFNAEVKRFGEVESKAVDLYNDAIEKSNQGKMDDDEFIRLLEQDVLPDWRALRKHLGEIRGLRGAQARRLELLKDYAAAREKGWETIVDGLRAGDSNKVDEGFAQEDKAEKILD